jgi:hypothetical protein
MAFVAHLCRLFLAILVISLAAGPLATAVTAVEAAAPQATAEHMRMAADEAMPAGMDCCPDDGAAMPDCDMSCPAAAMCVAKCPPSQLAVANAEALPRLAPWRAPGSTDPDGLASAPPGHPPKRQGVAAA